MTHIEHEIDLAVKEMVDIPCQVCTGNKSRIKHIGLVDSYTGVLFFFHGRTSCSNLNAKQVFQQKECRFCFYLSKKLQEGKTIIVGAVEFKKTYQKRANAFRNWLMLDFLDECQLYQVHSPLAVFDFIFRRGQKAESKSLSKERLQRIWLVDESTSPAELHESFWTEAGRLLHECVVNANNKGSDDDEGIAPTTPPYTKKVKLQDSDIPEMCNSSSHPSISSLKLGVETGTNLLGGLSLQDGQTLIRERTPVESVEWVTAPVDQKWVAPAPCSRFEQFYLAVSSDFQSFYSNFADEQHDCCICAASMLFLRNQVSSIRGHVECVSSVLVGTDGKQEAHHIGAQDTRNRTGVKVRTLGPKKRGIFAFEHFCFEVIDVIQNFLNTLDGDHCCLCRINRLFLQNLHLKLEQHITRLRCLTVWWDQGEGSATI